MISPEQLAENRSVEIESQLVQLRSRIQKQMKRGANRVHIPACNVGETKTFFRDSLLQAAEELVGFGYDSRVEYSHSHFTTECKYIIFWAKSKPKKPKKPIADKLRSLIFFGRDV